MRCDSLWRPLLVPLLGLLMTAMPAAESLEVREVVHLTDGSTVSGAITERVPGESYSVETPRGEVVTLPVVSIDRIEKLSIDPNDEAFSYRDLVILHSGIIFRGAIVEETPGGHIVLLADGGVSLRFDMDSVWRIASEKCAAGQSRAALGEHPTGGDLRREFRLELTINRIGAIERPGEVEQADRLDRLRDELSELETEQNTANALRAEGEASISRAREQLVSLESDASGLATELALRALSCAGESPETQAAILQAYDVVRDQLGNLRATALSRTQVDPRLLTEQVALEREMRRVELSSLLATPLPMGPLDPGVADLIPLFSQDERRDIYNEHRIRREIRPVLLNMVLPVGVGSFQQDDYLGGTISAVSMIGGLVILLDAAIYAGAHVDDPDYTVPVRTWVSLGAVAGSYLYSLNAPWMYRQRQNRRLADALRLDEVLEAEE